MFFHVRSQLSRSHLAKASISKFREDQAISHSRYWTDRDSFIACCDWRQQNYSSICPCIVAEELPTENRFLKFTQNSHLGKRQICSTQESMGQMWHIKAMWAKRKYNYIIQGWLDYITCLSYLVLYFKLLPFCRDSGQLVWQTLLWQATPFSSIPSSLSKTARLHS